MKLSKPFYIIIRGPLGIGKTAVAKELSKKLCAEIFHVDKVLEEIKLDQVDEKIGSIPSANFLKANDKIIPLIKNLLDNGKPVIIDGCFYHKEQIEDLIKKLKDYKHYAFNLKASLETCIKRDSKRKKVYGEEAARAVYNLVAKFDYGIPIKTENRTEKEVVKEILSHFFQA